jgi:archaellum component FlaF (FlaF/FlaG flagellin family)
LKRGQSWSIDYAVSMLIFIVAVVIVVGIVNNSFEDRSFQRVQEDANRLTDALMSDG